MEGSFNEMWLSEAYNIKTNPNLNCQERIWHRSWLESVAIRTLPYFAKRKSNYFFKKQLPYNEKDVLVISQENLPTIYHTLKVWGSANGYGSDVPKLQYLSKHLFDYHAKVFLIEKCQKEIANP